MSATKSCTSTIYLTILKGWEPWSPGEKLEGGGNIWYGGPLGRRSGVRNGKGNSVMFSVAVKFERQRYVAYIVTNYCFTLFPHMSVFHPYVLPRDIPHLYGPDLATVLRLLLRLLPPLSVSFTVH